MNKSERVIQYVISQKKRAKDASRSRRAKWQELWNLYQNRQDYSAKKDWQSKCFIPKLYMAVEQSSSMVKRAVLSTRKLFKLEPKLENDEVARRAAPLVEKLFKRHLEDSNFANTYGEMIKGAFLLGLGMPKVLWDGGLQFYNVDILNVYIDPLFEPSEKRPKYIIEYAEMDLADLREMAKDINKRAGKSIYKMREVNKIEEDFHKQDEEERRRRRGLSQHQKNDDKKVGLLQYWGDVVSEDGKSVERNRILVIANDKYLIRKQKNPFDHQLPPYVPTVPIVYPHRGICGVSLVEPVVTMQYAYNNIVNMVVDNLNFSVNKMFEVRPTQIQEPRNLTSLYPGKLIFKHTPEEVVREVRTNNVGNDVYNSLDFLNTEMEKGTAVTEFIMGISGKNKTATEAELKTAQAQGLFDVIARDLENNSLQRVLEMSLDLMFQYGPLAQYQELKGRLKLRVGGLSLLLAQREQVRNVIEAVTFAVKVPELRQQTDLKSLWQKYLDLRGLSEAYTEQPQKPTMEHAQMIQKKAAEDAKNMVSEMSPSQKNQVLAQMRT